MNKIMSVKAEETGFISSITIIVKRYSATHVTQKEEEIIINLLSKESEKTLVNNLVDLCDKRIVTTLEMHYVKPPYVQQKEIMAELGVSYAYFKKLEACGLKRVKIDPRDKTVFYKRADIYALMDKLAEHP